MSTTDPTGATSTMGEYSAGGYTAGPSRGYGWVVYAGCILLMLATLNVIDGIAAISNSKFFTQNATYVISNLNTYGWVLLCMGVVQGFVGLGVLFQVKGVRWLGVAIAALNAIVQLMFIPAYPFWSLSLFALDMLVIYGLVAHGARSETA
jgi:hypothetical protein